MALPKTIQPSTYEQTLELFRLLSPSERQYFLRQIHQEGLVMVHAVFTAPETLEPNNNTDERRNDEEEEEDDIVPMLLEAMPYNFSGGVAPPKGSKWNP